MEKITGINCIVTLAMIACCMAFVMNVAYASDPTPLQDFCVGVNNSHSAGNNCIVSLAMIACIMAFVMNLAFYVAYASDPNPLQDFCVGVNDSHSAVFVNGLVCKNPKDVTANDFLYKGFDTVGDTNNRLGAKAVLVDAIAFPGLNTLGVTMARIDFAPNGLNAPHLHPRGSEMLTVLEGTLYAGFVTSNLQSGGNKLYGKVLNKGDIFVFPQGLIHFQLNIGSTHAVANAAFGTQNPGRVDVANAVFGSRPLIWDDVLTKAFQVDEKAIESLEAQYWTTEQSLRDSI